MQGWLDSHSEECAAFTHLQEAKYSVKGTGIRDLDYAATDSGPSAAKTSKSGWIYQHDAFGKTMFVVVHAAL